ncbi:MAG: hypothetical protein SGBAC_006641 [Bacillariaceae sp.]
MQEEHDEREVSSDSEHSESFMIECERCDSSVSSVSLDGLDDESFRSYYSSVASAASATSLGADCDYNGEADDDDTSFGEETLKDILNEFASTRNKDKCNKKNPNLGFGESNAAIVFDLRSKRPRNRKQRTGSRRRRPGTKAPSQRTASPRSSLNNLDNASKSPILQNRPSFHKRPSMSELVAQDMLLNKDACTTDDESEDSSTQEDPSWHIRQHQSQSGTRGSRKQMAADNDDSADNDYYDEDEDNWSVSLRDHTRSSPHATTTQASSSAWPNLCRSNLAFEQRELGITDHGTIHLDSDSDDSSSMADSMFSDSSSSTSLEYNSGCESSEESACDESSYMEQSVTMHTIASSRAPQSPTMRSQQPFRQVVAGMLPLEEAAPTMEESLRSTLLSEHSRITCSTSKHLSKRSQSSREVAAKRNQVRSKLQQLDAHMLKVFGQTSTTTPEISQATRNSLRDQLTSPNAKNSDKLRASDLSYRSASQSMRSQNRSCRSTNGLLKSTNSQSTASLLTQSRVSSISNQGDNNKNSSRLMSPNHSKSTSSLLATKRSNADLKRQHLREAFSSHLGMSSSRLGSQSVRSRD